MVNVRDSALRVLLAACRPYRWRLVVMLALMTTKTVVEALMAVLLIPLFDAVLGGRPAGGMGAFAGLERLQAWFGSPNLLAPAAAVLVALAVIKSALAIGFNWVQYGVLADFERTARNSLFEKFLGVSWLYHVGQRAMHAVNTMFSEVNASRQCLASAIGLVDALLAVLVYAAAAAYISPGSTAATVAAAAVLGLGMSPVFRKMRTYGRQLVRSNQQLLQLFNEFVFGFKVIKGSRMEEIAQRVVEERTSERSRLMFRVSLLKSLPAAFIESFIVVAVVGFAALVHVWGLGRVSESAVVGLIIFRSFHRIAGLQTIWIKMAETLASLGTTADLANTLDREREARPAREVASFQSLEFRGVDFSYLPEREALSDVTLTIGRGEIIGVVGRSGAGKTTFIDLVLALLVPSGGEIRVNGASLQDLDPRAWRELLGYVPQEPILFHDTVVNNITLFRDGITREDVEAAVRQANADDFIAALPQGYETVIGDRGATLSGGQRQRLALARSLVRHPQLLLLDEATSSLDSFSERRIQTAIEGLRGKLTVVVVAHRLSTVMGADRIVVLDRGRIVETGHPEDLVRRNSHFSEMYALQTGER